MQQLNPSEISDIIRSRIESLDLKSEAQNEGTIVSVSDGIIRIHGLADAQYGEMIEFSGGVYGMALNLERDSVGVVVLGDYLNLSEGMTARCTGAFSKCRSDASCSVAWSTRSAIRSMAKVR